MSRQRIVDDDEFGWNVIAQNDCRPVVVQANRSGVVNVEVSECVVRLIDLEKGYIVE